MHTFLSSFSLEIMGIQAWHQRCLLPTSQDAINFSAYTLHDDTNKKVGVLCLESQLIPAGQEMPLFRLLDAMLSAIQLKRIPMLETHIAQDTKFILLMGQTLSQTLLASEEPLDALRTKNPYIHNNAKLLVTYHPLNLLLEPANKAKAWEDLKKIPLLL